jgi:uncharacterized repeat protein (TIGR01451 family)
MRTIISLLISILTCSFLLGQTPGIRWSHAIGGSSSEAAYQVQKTLDGGFLSIGDTYSNNFDISGNHGYSDILVVKTNAVGSLEWTKCFGGNSSDNNRKLIYNSDGTALVAGVTYSTNGNVSGNHGNGDIWLVKIDASGNILWQKCLGGSSTEELNDIKTTTDNGYILTGYTSSNDGDVTGNHGGRDVWVVKISGTGVIDWQKCYGGSSNENPQYIMEVSDGNFIVVGSTASSDGDVVGQHGSDDVWVLKLNSTGSIIWQKPYGGSNSDGGSKIALSNSGNLIVLANTLSTNGDVTSNHGFVDTWVFSVDYVNGNLNWQKCIGGTWRDIPRNLFKDGTGTFLVTSSTESGDGDASSTHGDEEILLTSMTESGLVNWTKCFGGNRTDRYSDILNDTSASSYVLVASTSSSDGDISGYHQNIANPDTLTDAWVVKINYSGNILWQRCIGGSNDDNLYSIAKVDAGNLILAGETLSNDGDIVSNHGSDVWIVELGPVNRIKGTIFLDNNSNGLKDAGEPYYSNVMVKSKKIDSIISIPYGGLFINEVDTGNYITAVSLNLPYYNVVPSSVSSSFTTYFNTDSISFALQPIPNKQDLTISIVPTIAARPGFSSMYRIFYKNIGTITISSGEILFKKDSRTTFVSSSPTVTTTNGDTLKWSYSNFAPGDTASIFLTLQVLIPPTVNVGDTLSCMAIITPVTADETPLNDTAILKQRVVGSIDPNDKTENNGGVVSSSFITSGDYLQYTVRFQNTGTADAINVVVRDTLGNRVDLSTLEVVTASHPYTLRIENGNELIWQFDNIMLPASSVDEPGSHGYIVYRIRPKSDVVVGETIHNTASIYFDYNLPVLTNDATTLVQDNFSALPIQLLSFTGQLNNNTVQLKWKVSDAQNFERFEIERSVDGRIYNRIGNVLFNNSIADYSSQDNISTLQSNHIFYRLKLIDADGKFTYSKVIAFNINAAQNNFIVYPNPAKTEMYVSITSNKNENLHLKIVDASGRTVADQQKEIQKGNNIFPVNTSKLKGGNYVLQFVLNGEVKASKFTIMN